MKKILIVFSVLVLIIITGCGSSATDDSPSKDTSSSVSQNQQQPAPKEDIPSKILGANKTQVKTIFTEKGYHPIKSYYSFDYAFEISHEIESHVIFNENGNAIGVAFESNNNASSSGEDSYVYQHYDELVKWVTGGEKVKIENDSEGVTKYPVDIFIGEDRSDEDYAKHHILK